MTCPPLSVLLSALMEHCLPSTCCNCCIGENDVWCFKITPVICTSVSEKWDLPSLDWKYLHYEPGRNKKQINQMEILHQIVIHERGGSNGCFISSAQNHETGTAPETKQNRNSALWHAISMSLEFQTNFLSRVPYRHTSIYALAA
jgi:hypothetical protein